jgi:hypothetical protein
MIYVLPLVSPMSEFIIVPIRNYEKIKNLELRKKNRNNEVPLLWCHNDTPFGRPTPGWPVGHLVVGHQGTRPPGHIWWFKLLLISYTNGIHLNSLSPQLVQHFVHVMSISAELEIRAQPKIKHRIPGGRGRVV